MSILQQGVEGLPSGGSNPPEVAIIHLAGCQSLVYRSGLENRRG